MTSMRAVNYSDQLLQVIDRYIKDDKQSKEKSAGVQRAKAMKSMIAWQLQSVEKLTDRQLMWRMLAYSAMEHGSGPFQSSTKLRYRILRHLCNCLFISNDSIKNECEIVRCRELQMAISAPFTPGIFYFEDTNNIVKMAMINLIKLNLKRIYQYDDKLSLNLVLHLITVFNDYIEEKSGHFFSGAACADARRAQEMIRGQWVLYENLNELQMLWRLYEQLQLPGDGGIFNFDEKLRSKLIGALCQYLQCDKASIACDVDVRTGPSHFRHSWFGPVFVPAMDGRLYQEVCLNHIVAKLVERSPSLQHPNEMRRFIAN